MIRIDLRAAALAAACAALTACGGGGGASGTSTGAIPPKLPTSAMATFIVKVPAKPALPASKRPAYITSNVQGIDFSVSQSGNAVAGTYVFYPLTAQSPNCTSSSGGLTCTLAVVAVPGDDTFTVNLYDAVEPYQGYIVSTGHVNAAISAQSNNSVSITTDGVPTWAVLGAENPYPATGVTTQIPLSLQVVDPDGNIIVGSFDTPLTVSDSDTSGATSVTPTTIAQSSDASNVVFTNAGSGTAPITVSVTSTSPARARSFGPTMTRAKLTPGGSGPAATPGALYFAHANSSAQTITVTGENASAGPFTLTQCSAFVNVTGTSPTFTVTPIASTFSTTAPGYLSSGTCGMVLADSNGNTTPITIMVGQ